MLPLMLSGYLFLLIFRPYEYWEFFGVLRIERVYMLIFMAVVFFSKEKQFISSSINGAVICFSLTLMVSAAFGIDWSNSWPFVVDYFKYVVFYFMVILSVRDEEDFRLVILAFLGVMFLYVAKSAWEFFIHDRYVFRMGIKRLSGIDITYGDPNAFAASICYSLPLAWAMIRSRFNHPWVRRFLWGYGLLALIAIMFTGSRSGMVTFILFLFLIVMGSSRKVLGIVLAGIILLVSWDYMPDDLRSRFLSTFSDEYAATAGAAESAGGRAVGFKHGLEIWRQNPILGVGPNNFSLSWGGLERGPNAHNIYGQLLGELGTVGACAFGLLLLLMYRKNSQVVDHARTMKLKAADDNMGRASGRTVSVGGFSERNAAAQPSSIQRIQSILSVLAPQEVYFFVSQAIIQIIILILFKGWADHNLYRYTWLWLAALTVLCNYFIRKNKNL